MPSEISPLTAASTIRRSILASPTYANTPTKHGTSAPVSARRASWRRAPGLLSLLAMVAVLHGCHSGLGHLMLESGSDIGLDRIPRVTQLTDARFPATESIAVIPGIEWIPGPYVALAEIEATVMWRSQRGLEECLRLEAPAAMERRFAPRAMKLGAHALVLIEADISAQNVLNPSTRVYTMFIRSLAIRYSDVTSPAPLTPVPLTSL